MPSHSWSRYQQAIFSDFENGSGHSVIDAVAGSGKTATVLEGIKYVPESTKIYILAFNKSIEVELRDRCSRGADIRTFHGAGRLAISRAFGEITVEERKGKRIAEEICVEAGYYFDDRQNRRVPIGAAKVAQLASLAKNKLIGWSDDDATAIPQLIQLAVDFDIEVTPQLSLSAMAALAREALRRAAQQRKTVDFDDMVWFPARFELRPASHDFVVIDERQDLNAAQLYLAQALCRKGGRIIAVGDEHQCIYGFMGADIHACRRMVSDLKATRFPLNTSYRSPQKMAALAREVVPQFESAPNAIDGIVESTTLDRMIAEVNTGDFVLSRTRAALVHGALRVIARGVPVSIAGRDIEKRIVRLIERSKSETVSGLSEWLERWRRTESERLRAIDREDKIEEVTDLIEVVYALCEGETSTIDVVRRASALFVDSDPKTRVLFSTVHRVKGLERDRVWMYGDTFRLWHGERWEQERNLYYVAVTRAKRELRIIGEVLR